MSTTSTQEIFAVLVGAQALGANATGWKCQSFTGTGGEPGTKDADQPTVTAYDAELVGGEAVLTFATSDGQQYTNTVGLSGAFELQINDEAPLVPPSGWTLIDAGPGSGEVEIWDRWGSLDGVTRKERRFSLGVPLNIAVTDLFTFITGQKLSVDGIEL